MTAKLILFDTSVLIDHLRTGMHEERIASLSGLLRTSAVVLAELWRGARSAAEFSFLQALESNHPVLSPTEKNWLESGQILGRIHKDTGCTPGRLRDLHFDVLIALTARTHGAQLITSNQKDFELIARYRPFHLEVWQPAR